MQDVAEQNFFSSEVLSDPLPFYERIRQHQPVSRQYFDSFGEDVFVVTSYALVKRAFQDNETFSSDFNDMLMRGAEPHPEADELFKQGVKVGPLLLTIDEPEHKRYRSLATVVFTPRQVRNLSASMEDIIDGLIDRVIDRGECDFLNEIAVPYPIYVIADLLGVDRDIAPRLRRWSDAFIIRLSQKQTKAEDLQAVRDILDCQSFLFANIADRRARPREDVISHVVQARVAGVDPLTDREALLLLQEISVAGNETSRNTLAGGMGLLAQRPDVIERLRADPELIPNAVEEILRLLAPTTGMWRVAKQDCELGGVRIPAGSMLLLRMDAANRDPDHFPDPDNIVLERRNRVEHLSFGFGAHHCVGNMLARRELAVAFKALLNRMRNIRLVEEKTDLSSITSILHYAPKAISIAFDRH